MQPRWMNRWVTDAHGPLPKPHCTFLGGTNDFDLWVDADGDLRVVCGERGAEWDYYQMIKGEGLVRISEEMDITDEQFNEVLRYLALFAPDWMERVPVWSIDSST